MWDPTDNWAQQGSFVEPVVPPTSQPGDTPLVCIEVNQLWIPYILGALQQLVQPTSWTQGSGTVTVEDAQDAAQDLIGIIGTAPVCHLAPSCAGIDPGHSPTVSISSNNVGIWTTLHIGAGQTAGGAPIAWVAQDFALPAPGNYVVGVDADGTLHVLAAGPDQPPGDQVLVLSFTLEGNGGIYQDGSNPDVTDPNSHLYTVGDLSVFVDHFAVANPVLLPSFDMDNADFNNPSTPAGSTSGLWARHASDGLAVPFSVLGFTTAIDPVVDTSDPMCAASVSIITANGLGAFGHPLVGVGWVTNASSGNLADGVSYRAGDYHQTVGVGAHVQFYDGINEWDAYGTYPHELIASGGASLYPTITVQRNFSTC